MKGEWYTDFKGGKWDKNVEYLAKLWVGKCNQNESDPKEKQRILNRDKYGSKPVMMYMYINIKCSTGYHLHSSRKPREPTAPVRGTHALHSSCFMGAVHRVTFQIGAKILKADNYHTQQKQTLFESCGYHALVNFVSQWEAKTGQVTSGSLQTFKRSCREFGAVESQYIQQLM